MGDFTMWPAGAAGVDGAGSSATCAAAGAGATGACMGAATYCWTTPPTLLTMRTLPSASVISSSETFDSDTRSMRVLSFRRSMEAPTAIKLNRARIYSYFTLSQSSTRIFHELRHGKVPFYREKTRRETLYSPCIWARILNADPPKAAGLEWSLAPFYDAALSLPRPGPP